MNVAGYVRVSTDKQADKGYSIGEQTERLTAYCKARDWNLVKVYTDPGFSGGGIDRPALQQLVDDIRAYDVVLVNKLDRLSRSQKDTLYLIQDVFTPAGCSFVSMQESFDTSTPIGIAMVGILSAFAQLERSQIKERMQMGIAGRKKKGLWHGAGTPPTGYDYIDGRLVPNEDAEQVRVIFQKYLEGLSPRQITVYLGQHYSAKRTAWGNSCTVRGILTNRIYIGMVGDYPGQHDPLIDRETFDRVQTILAGHKQGKKTPRGSHLLTGFSWCGYCGQRVCSLVSTQKRIDGHTERYGYYKCSHISHTRLEVAYNHCSLRPYKEKDADALVTGQVLALRFEDIAVKPPARIDNSSEIAKITRQISRLMDLYSTSDDGLDEIKEKISGLRKKRQTLQDEQDNQPEPQKITKKSINAAHKVMRNGTVAEKRAVLDTLVERITFYNDRIDIQWRF